MAQSNFSPIKQKLLDRKYKYNKIILDGSSYHQYTAPAGGRWTYSWHFRNYPFISIAARNISIDKQESYAFAKLHNVAAPQTIQPDSLEDAIEFLRKHRPVIVKPLDAGGGKGLTIGIETETELITALEKAREYCSRPLVQSQFYGDEIRLTVLRGKVKSVILRQTPRVIGDGRKTIQQLIYEENEARKSLNFEYLSYPQLDSTNIPDSYLSSDAVLADQKILEFSKATMIKDGASFYGITKQVHSSYIDIAEKLAHSLNPAMLVIDLMVNDYREPASPTNYIFLEFNTAPAPAMYSSLRAGDKPDIVEELVEMIDEYCSIYR